MATPGRSAADYKAETAMKIQGSLDKERLDSLGNALGKALGGKYDLMMQRSKRGSDILEAVTNYENAVNRGSTVAQIQAVANLRKMERELPVKFASAAYAPNTALLNAVSAAVPLNLKSLNPKDPQVAAIAWQTFFMDARATDGNMLGSWREMVAMYGDPQSPDYGASNPAISDAAKNFFRKKETAEQNAKLFEENMRSLDVVGEPYEAFVERTGMPAESDDTVRAFLKNYPDLAAKLPAPNAPFINTLKTVAQDPEKSKAFFSDIDASITAAAEDEEKYLGLLGVGKETADVERTDLEKKVAWLQRSDVQAWGKKWGYNLGTVQPVTPEIQKLIDEGQISKDSLVNGMLYTPSPDDERAARFALRQLGRNPQKNIFYNMGLTKQAGPRTVMEVEEIVSPAGERPKGVESRTVTGANGKAAVVVKLDDGSYAVGPAQKGASYTKLSAEDGAKLFDTGTDARTFEEPVELNGVEGAPAKTRTRRIQSLGPELYRDASGAERGIDLDTGEMVVIPPEKIASKEVTHGGVPRKSLGEALLERRAARTVKKEGIDISTEAQNAMDIGPEATKKQIQESAQTTAEIAKGLPDVPASYVGEELVDRVRGPLTEAEIAQQDTRTATGAAGVSPFEQVKPGDYKPRRESMTPKQRAAESALFGKALSTEGAAPQDENAMFEAALGSFPTKPKAIPLPVKSPAPGVVMSGLPGPAPTMKFMTDQAKVGTTTGAEVEAEAPAQKTAFFRRRAALAEARAQQSRPSKMTQPVAESP